MENGKLKTLLLIDVSHLYWSNYHATADKSVNEAYELTVGKVHQLRDGYDYVACAVDTPPYWRKEVFSEYKANREAQPPQAIELFERVKERLASDGILMWGVRGFEADDVAAWAVANGWDRCTITLASGDKDWLQLVDDARHVKVLSTRTNAIMREEQVIEKLGVHPSMVPDFLALVGDKSDNVPGVPGVGPVKAAKLLLKYGTLADVLGNADKETPALRDALIYHAEAARLARKVVTLRTDVPLKFDELFADRKPMNLTPEPAYDGETGELFEDEPDLISPPKPDSEPFQPKPPPKSEPPPAAAEALPDAQQTTVLALHDEWALRLEPQTGSDAYALAKVLYNSRLYTKFPNHQAIFAVILRGREMGLSALTALDCFHVVEGKPVPQAHLIIAKAKAHPDCEYFQMLSADSSHAEYETKNRCNPRPTRLRYTIEQARAVGLLEPSKRTGAKSMWVKRPDEMLRKTCATQLARIEYPDAAMGLYALEELEGNE